jgi:iron complex transport system substrate-binding protein
MNRRTLLATAGAVALTAGLLAGCSTGSTDADAADAADAPTATTSVDPHAFPVTIEHALGSTTIAAEPHRIVTIGWTDGDDLLALGVVPVGAQRISWGGNAQGSTAWFDARLHELGGTQPERYDADASLPVSAIAKMAPDLILATNSGVTQAQYDKLSKIAPTVAYPDAPYVTSWQQSLRMVGEAVGRSTAAAEVEKRTEAALRTAQTDHPQLVGTSVLVTGVADNTKLGTISVYGANDVRPRLLTELGMTIAPAADRFVPKDAFYADVSSEKATQLDSDLLINLGFAPGSFEALQRDRLLSRIPAIRSGHYLDLTDQPLELTFGAATPLSIPYFIDRLVPKIAQAVDGGRVDVAP